MTDFIDPPQSKESEMLVLGCMISSIESVVFATSYLEENDFYYPKHQTVFRVLKKLCDEDKPADVHLLAEDLKKLNQLEVIGGIPYLMKLAQYAGTAVYIEEYAQELKRKSQARQVISLFERTKRDLLKHPDDLSRLLEIHNQQLVKLEVDVSSRIPLIAMEKRLDDHNVCLEKFKGQKYLGLCQKTIPLLDDMLLGMRKLVLLAAAPNVGKTAFAAQLGLDILLNDPSACMVFFSLEMTCFDVLTRMKCARSGLSYRTLIFGSKEGDKSADSGAYFSAEELQSICNAENELSELGLRLQIIDSSTCPRLTAGQAINYINEVKNKSRCSRVVVIIDYLQVWPLTEKIIVPTELEIDKWRIGQIKQIRDAVNDDPVIVISEARKPSGTTVWGGDLSDIMGSARGAYTPDVAILYTPINPEELVKLWNFYRIPEPKVKEEERGEKIKEFLKRQGIGIYRIEIAKGRDGMEKGHFFVEFHYRKSSFRPLDLGLLKHSEELKGLKDDPHW